MSVGVLINIGLGFTIAIATVIGLLVGFSRQFSKPLVVLVSIFVAVMLTTLIFPLIFNTGILNGFVDKATGWFSAEFYSRPVTDVESFQAAISDNYLKIFSGSADRVFARMQIVLEGYDEMTIGLFFGRSIVNLIIGFALWLIFYLVVKYFLYGIQYLLCMITEVVVFKSIDRILGLIWALLLTYIIVVGIGLTAAELIVTQFLPEQQFAFAEIIRNASLLKLAHDTNVLGSFLANLLAKPLIDIV